MKVGQFLNAESSVRFKLARPTLLEAALVGASHTHVGGHGCFHGVENSRNE